mgnify:CR=1 FL=1
MGGKIHVRRVQDMDANGRTVLVRVDYNVPLEGRRIGDDARIRTSLPTIRHLVDAGAKIVLATHLGRPAGRRVDALRLDPVSERLSELLGRRVEKLPDCVGDEILSSIESGGAGDIFLLENVRFHPEEEANDPEFAAALAAPADVFVNDAFATIHRGHASTYGVAEYLPSFAGLLVQRELEALERLRDGPERPYVAIVGGKKASSKLGPLRDLVSRVDGVLVGGGVAFTLLRAMGASVGDSRVEDDVLEEAAEIVRLAEDAGVELLLPKDAVVARELSDDAETTVGDARSIPEGWAAFDIGPETVRAFAETIRRSRSLVWTGPMGAFEFEPFSQGTIGVAEAVAQSSAFSVIGGGETGEAIARFGFAERVSYVSTGGGACLAVLRGKRLPALTALLE